MTVRVTGIKDIDRKLATLEPKLQKKVVRSAMRKGMAVVSKEAKSNAPKDTGQLRKSIKVRAGKRSRKFMSLNVQTDKGHFQGDTFYGSFLEFGYRKGHRRLGSDRKEIPGLHYMERAYQSKGNQARHIAIEEIRKGIDRIVEGT